MNGTRRRPARPMGRLALGLSSLALFAFAYGPALAYADSSEVQYSEVIPPATGGKAPNGGAPASSSSSAAGASTSSAAGQGAGRAGSRRRLAERRGGVAGARGIGGTGHQGSRAKGSAGESSASIRPAGGATVSQGSGSSPLVAIVCAILALAVISIGTVLFRQRRHRATPVSPKAG